MKFFTIRLFTAFFASLVLAGPAAAGTGPNSKRPVAPRHAYQTLDTVGKGSATKPAKKTVALQQVGAATSLVAVVPAGAAPAAPQMIKLQGIVLNADGQPCPGASVYPAGAPRQLVVTDANGAFALPVPMGAPVSLRIEYFGLGNSRVEVAAPSAEVLHITLGH